MNILFNNSFVILTFLVIALQFNFSKLQEYDSAESNATIATNPTYNDNSTQTNTTTTTITTTNSGYSSDFTTQSIQITTANSNSTDSNSTTTVATQTSTTTPINISSTEPSTTRTTTTATTTTVKVITTTPNFPSVQLYPLTLEEFEKIKVTLYDLKVAIITIGCFTGVAIVALFVLLIFLTAKRNRFFRN